MLRSEKGFALIITLLVTAIIIAAVTELVYGIYISVSKTNNFKNSQRASLLARAGVDMAKAGIEEMRRINPYMTMDKEGLSFAYTKEEGNLELRGFDEQGKVSLRIVYPNTGVSNERLYGNYIRLLKLLGHDDTLSDTLADWIDMDDEPRRSGAEWLDYYQRLPHPYKPKNDNLDSLEEILMIKGYTPQLYKKLSPFVTVYTDGLVNINTAGREALIALSDEMTELLAQKIIAYRKETPFKDRSDIMKVDGFGTLGFSLQDRITVQGSIFRIYSRGVVEDAVREVEAVVQIGGRVIYWREG
ncbi:MAG: type II secretion system minor pseudopilin GspK [Nitrospinae bacterium]|nr:type II secretion system minor pseudopilin GspK [Nitrospinota bacterium]